MVPSNENGSSHLSLGYLSDLSLLNSDLFNDDPSSATHPLPKDTNTGEVPFKKSLRSHTDNLYLSATEPDDYGFKQRLDLFHHHWEDINTAIKYANLHQKNESWLLCHYELKFEVSMVNFIHYDSILGNDLLNPANLHYMEEEFQFACLDLIPMITEKDTTLLLEQANVNILLKDLPNVPTYKAMSARESLESIRSMGDRRYYVIEGIISTLWEPRFEIISQTFKCEHFHCTNKGYLNVSKIGHNLYRIVKRSEENFFFSDSIRIELPNIDNENECNTCQVKMLEVIKDRITPRIQWVALTTKDQTTVGPFLNTSLFLLKNTLAEQFSLGEEVKFLCRGFLKDPSLDKELLDINYINQNIVFEVNNYLPTKKLLLNRTDNTKGSFWDKFEKLLEPAVPIGIWVELKKALLLSIVTASGNMAIDEKLRLNLNVMAVGDNYGNQLWRVFKLASQIIKANIWSYGLKGKNTLIETHPKKDDLSGYSRGDVLSSIKNGILLINLNDMSSKEAETLRDTLQFKNHKPFKEFCAWGLLEVSKLPRPTSKMKNLQYSEYYQLKNESIPEKFKGLVYEFDLFIAITDKGSTSYESELLIDHILNTAIWPESQLEQINKELVNSLTNLLQEISRVEIMFPEYCREILQVYYIILRKGSTDQALYCIKAPVRILEDLMIFSKSHAKIYSRRAVNLEDVMTSIKLFESNLLFKFGKSIINLDPTTEVQTIRTKLKSLAEKNRSNTNTSTYPTPDKSNPEIDNPEIDDTLPDNTSITLDIIDYLITKQSDDTLQFLRHPELRTWLQPDHQLFTDSVSDEFIYLVMLYKKCLGLYLNQFQPV